MKGTRTDGDSSSQLAELAGALRLAKSVVVLTGAGVSAESGLRTFREAQDALWKDFDPMKMATPEAFAADPQTVTRWYDSRRMGVLEAKPNSGHFALAELERRVLARKEGTGRFALLTQNVDRLHQRAGSTNVVELHGSIVEWRCTETGRTVVPPASPFEVFPPVSPFAAGGVLRPNVVWFGEMLPETALTAAERAMEMCDLFLSIGTSAVVYPAAGFAHAARARGARVAEINREATPLSGAVDWSIRGASGEVLPALLLAAFGGRAAF